MYNSKLEDLIMGDITPETQDEIFDLLRESQLFMPVSYPEPGSVDDEGDGVQPENRGFNINYLVDNDGNNAIPLFTSGGMMSKSGLQSTSITVFLKDLVEMLKHTDKYGIIVINPFTECELSLSVDALINLFDDKEKIIEALNEILKMLNERSTLLESDLEVYVRSDDDYMVEEASNGVFTPNIPFNVSTNREFQSELKYLNIILMPKSTRILHFNNLGDENNFDSVIAPGSELHLVERIDEFTILWKCGAQPFYG